MTSFEILQHLRQLMRGSPGLESKDPVDDVVGAGLIRRIEIARLGRRLEWSDDDPGWVWVKV